jgi:hypothetical protein
MLAVEVDIPVLAHKRLVDMFFMFTSGSGPCFTTTDVTSIVFHFRWNGINNGVKGMMIAFPAR